MNNNTIFVAEVLSIAFEKLRTSPDQAAPMRKFIEEIGVTLSTDGKAFVDLVKTLQLVKRGPTPPAPPELTKSEKSP